MKFKFPAAIGAAIVAASLALAGCGAGGGSASDPSKPLKVLASSTPHGELIKQAEKSGLLGDVKIDLTEITGDIDANQVLESGDIDANLFQHRPYLDAWQKDHGVDDLVPVAYTHVEPIGLYSKKTDDPKTIPDGGTVAIPSDITNQARGLFLLVQAGLIEMDVTRDTPNLDFTTISQKNITSNPRNLKFLEIDRPNLPKTLDDPKVYLSVVNGNYALEANLTPNKDALVLEEAKDSPYTNVLVVKKELTDDPRVKKLAEALEAQQTKDFITETFKGAVVPAEITIDQ